VTALGHIKCRWTSFKLAEHFKIREQRAIAILALKDMEKKAEAGGEELFHSAQQIVEEFYGGRSEGTGEKFHMAVVKYPRFRVRHPQENPKCSRGIFHMTLLSPSRFRPYFFV
jgi:hypothetical protein